MFDFVLIKSSYKLSTYKHNAKVLGRFVETYIIQKYFKEYFFII